MLDSKPTAFPLEHNHKLAISTSLLLDKPEAYRRLIRRLIYLAVTRPDLAFSIHVLAQFLQTPQEDHRSTALCVVRYLKGTAGQCILLRSDSDLQLNGWCDSDWASCPITRRSVIGYFVQLDNSPIFWKTRKQPTVSLSSAEADYRAMTFLVQELIWLKRILVNLGVSHDQPTFVYCDSESANERNTSKTIIRSINCVIVVV